MLCKNDPPWTFAKQVLFTLCFYSGEIPQNVFPTFDNTFHVFLMREFQKYARNWILTMAFWATCKIAQPIQPIWQHIFALPWSALKKPPWEFNFYHIFGIPSSSRHEKCRQILQTLFWVFQYSRNSQWGHYLIQGFSYSKKLFR